MSGYETAPVPPQNLDAEESVLGACMLAESAITATSEVLKPSDFYRASHGKMYQAILGLYTSGSPVDAITLCDELDRLGLLDDVGGRTRINELAALVPATSNAGHYARIVAEQSVLRGMARAGQEITRLAFERDGEDIAEVLDRAEESLYRVALQRDTGDFTKLRDSLHDTFERIEQAAAHGSEVIGVPTGYVDFDRATSGLQPGNLVVVAGRPSMGKSAWLLGALAHACVAKGPVALFTLEMNKAEVTQRLLSMGARVDASKIRTGRLDGDEWKRLVDYTSKLSNAPFYVDDTASITVMEIRSKARRLKARERDLSLIAVDYLQLMSSGAHRFESRVQEVSQISRALKVLARELDLPVVALSQLSRAPEQRHDKRPLLSDLRESGSIEQDADLVVFPYRDEYYNPDDPEVAGIAEVSIAKHRNGPTTVVKMAFLKRFASFGDLLHGDTARPS